LKNTNISIVKYLNLYFLTDELFIEFTSDVCKLYGYLSNYTHSTPKQIMKRQELKYAGRSIKRTLQIKDYR